MPPAALSTGGCIVFDLCMCAYVQACLYRHSLLSCSQISLLVYVNWVCMIVSVCCLFLISTVHYVHTVHAVSCESECCCTRLSSAVELMSCVYFPVPVFACHSVWLLEFPLPIVLGITSSFLTSNSFLFYSLAYFIASLALSFDHFTWPVSFLNIWTF